MRVKSIDSHTLLGLLWFDLPLGLLLTLIYLRVVKKPLINHLPRGLNEQFSPYTAHSTGIRLSWLYLTVLSTSVLIGAASHLLWDGFTHPTGSFVSTVPMITHIISLGSHRFYVYKLLQHLSTLAGLAIILAVILKLPKQKRTLHLPIKNYWIQVAAVMVITIIIRVLTGLSFRQYGHLVVTAISGFWLGLLLVSVLSLRKRILH
jgi:ABC-type xylose transport system permease subunit